VSIKLPDSAVRRLDAVAARRGAPRSAVMREAIEDYLAHDERATATVADLVSDLLGGAEGPEDLSTNKGHLAGFGG
jgi:predicted transcriptional regulator